MNKNLVACIKQNLSAKSDSELLEMWRAGYAKRDSGEAREALRQLCAERGLKVSGNLGLWVAAIMGLLAIAAIAVVAIHYHWL